MSELQPAIDFVTRTSRFIITAHETPDADAVGSECAMLRALKALGKEAMILNADPTPRKFTFIDPDSIIGVLKQDDQLPEDIAQYSLLVLDTNDVNNIGQIARMVLPKVREHFIIDHHEQDGDLLAGNVVVKSASSTSEILYQLFKELAVPIDFQIARALFTGIVFDTGSFVYPKTTALTFDVARDLVSRGVEPNVVYSKLYESNSVSALLLESRVLSTLELRYDNHVSILTMRRQTIVESGADYEEADQLINIPLRSQDVRVSIFFKENMEGLLRCSLRSKGNINVAAIAQSFGGGGHKTAAGFKCHEPLEATQKILLEKLRTYFS